MGNEFSVRECSHANVECGVRCEYPNDLHKHQSVVIVATCADCGVKFRFIGQHTHDDGTELYVSIEALV